jgi:hypothetical protein
LNISLAARREQRPNFIPPGEGSADNYHRREQFEFSQNRFDNLNQRSTLPAPDGVVAQLVEHHNGIVGVRGSNPLGSTILKFQELRAFSGLRASHKSCSDVGGAEGTAVFLVFGFRLRPSHGGTGATAGQVVSAQSQGYSNLFLRRSLAKNQKSSLHTAASFMSML